MYLIAVTFNAVAWAAFAVACWDYLRQPAPRPVPCLDYRRALACHRMN